MSTQETNATPATVDEQARMLDAPPAARRRAWAWAIGGAVGFVAGLVLGAIIVLSVLRNPAGVPPLVPLPTTLAGQSVVSARINGAFVTRKIVTSLRQQGLANPEATLQAPRNVVTAFDTKVDLSLFAVNVRPVATVQFSVEHGRIRANISAVNVSELDIPRSLIDQQLSDIERQIATQLDQVTTQLEKQGLTVVGLRVEGGDLVVDLAE